MKKIRLFSAKATRNIEGGEAKLYVNFYLVLDRDFIFRFLIEAPDLACSDKHPIKLWKYFLITLEEDWVKYVRRYEEASKRKVEKNDETRSYGIHSGAGGRSRQDRSLNRPDFRRSGE